MLSGHPLIDRLRIVGFSEEPAWRPLAPEICDQPGWDAGQLDRDGLGHDVARVVAAEFEAGALRDAGALVVECTVIPQFRGRHRSRPLADIVRLLKTGHTSRRSVSGWPSASNLHSNE